MKAFVRDAYRGYRLQLLFWTFVVPCYAFFIFDSATIVNLTSPLQIFVYKTAVAALSLVYLHFFLTACYICFLFPFAAPGAMQQLYGRGAFLHWGQTILSPPQILRNSLVNLFGLLEIEICRPTLQLVSIAELFSPSTVPYRLHPLSCSLLE
jgi:hypothetical protein